MILKTELRAKRIARMFAWHRWFAWYPVSWDGGFVWMQTIERKACDTDPFNWGFCVFQYRLIGEERANER